MDTVAEKNNAIEVDTHLITLSAEALETLTAIDNRANRELARGVCTGASAIANPQTFTGTESVNRIIKAGDSLRDGYAQLKREPAIARLVYEDEEGGHHTLYITRGMPVQPENGFSVTSVKAPLGRLAALDVGDSAFVTTNNQEQELVLVEVAILKPNKDGDGWDSLNTVHKHEILGIQTIVSLRQLLNTVANEDDFEDWLDGDGHDSNVVAGIVHEIRTVVGLRDQLILDKFQDKIFRLPLNSQLFIVGPPGTGKTTTLIKRLGQKLNEAFLTPEEQQLVITSDGASHAKSWLMFTPTELLKHYVKEAFAREQVPASDDHIRTWEKTRRDLARNVMGLLQSGTSKAKFILKSENIYLTQDVEVDPIAWFDNFNIFHAQQVYSGLLTALEQAKTGLYLDNKVALEKLEEIIQSYQEGRLPALFERLEKLDKDLTPAINSAMDEAEQLAIKEVKSLYQKDKAIFLRLAEFLTHLAIEESEEEEVDDEVDDAETDNTELSQSSLSPQDAAKTLKRLVKSAGRNKFLSRSISKRSKVGKVMAFLGDFAPEAESLKLIGRSVVASTGLRHFVNAHRRYVTDIATSYKRFRKNNQAYYKEIPNNHDMSNTELDAVILLTLMNSREVFKLSFVKRDEDNARFSYLGVIKSKFKNQILVDEATDFSVLQLACMQCLTSIETNSFFACGDFNQRLTLFGVRDKSQLDWLPINVDYRSITSVYRQSKLLNDFSRTLLLASGGDESSAGDLPDELNHLGVKPVLALSLSTIDEVADWLADRIIEIERSVNQIPSIGVLVENENVVEPLANSLGKALSELNLEAEACLGGKSLGENTDVRVFSAEHIKGLEFEAVFFVNIDKLAEELSELFDKYLYVGVTRAATYLGISCAAQLPEQLESVKGMFTDSWKN